MAAGIRNVFDQYTQPENRLTHALLSCLISDLHLLRKFCQWSVHRQVDIRSVEIFEQSWPGDPMEYDELIAEKRGLPDGVIMDGNGLVILIESKVKLRLTAGQIRRHINTAARRALRNCVVLCITVHSAPVNLPEGVTVLSWSEVYEWMMERRRRSSWAKLFADYLPVAEQRFIDNEYLVEGKLTMFSGIPFGPDHPYSYREAKRLIGLIREEMLLDKRLVKAVALNAKCKGRGAITGRAGHGVWDYIRPVTSPANENFTSYPHFTIGIGNKQVDAYVTFPNSIKRALRRQLLGVSYEEFSAKMQVATKRLLKALSGVKGAAPMIVVVQRRYPTQRSPAIVDADIRFDLRTAFREGSRHRKGNEVKVQGEWLRATYDAFSKRRSNLQFQIGAMFLLDGTCPVAGRRELKDVIGKVWAACGPLTREQE